jgi:formylglycine-generating enzyme required for sulfatase activity
MLIHCCAVRRLLCCLTLSVAMTAQAPPGEEGARDVGVGKRELPVNVRVGARLAVVVGVNDYKDLPDLRLAEKDAKDMDAALRGIGFSVRALHSDAETSPGHADTIMQVVTEMCVSAEDSDMLLIYMSGHGFSEPGGIPYFCARFTDREQLPLTGLNLDEVIRRLKQSRAKQKMMIIDACRNTSSKGAGDGDFVTEGLDTEGLAILYSTSKGSRSWEPSPGDMDRLQRRMENGVFTHFLLRGLEGDSDANGDGWVTFGEVANYVFDEVRQHMRNQQKPRIVWDADAKFDIILRRPTGDSTTPRPASRPPATVPSGGRSEVEEEIASEMLREVGKWADVLQLEVDPAVVTDARARDRIQESGWPWKVRERKTGIRLVLVPGGRFTMGSPPTEQGRNKDETLNTRDMAKPFYMGESEVTVAQWKRLKNGGNGDSDELPKDSVSWVQVQTYLKSVGNGLRLPTEAEWEYACRAGTETPYSFGARITEHQVNCDVNGKRRSFNQREFLQKALDQPANAFGLRGMHGNLWEWVQDEYGSYRPELGQAAYEPPNGKSDARVIRGGGYASRPEQCRSASRLKLSPGTTNPTLGFRVARSLP